MARLVALAPGGGQTTAEFDPLLRRLQSEPEWDADTKILPCEHHATIFSLRRANDLAADMADRILTEWETNGPYDDVILMGFSAGGILSRAAYLRGLGSTRKNRAPKEWAKHVSRIVLFAAPNRGLHLRWYERLLLTLMPWQFLLRDLLIGSDFITNIRLWWVRKLDRMETRPIVVQIRGTQDSRVQRGDSLDIEGFLEGYALSLDAKHDDLLKPDQGAQFSDEKYDVFRQAILRPFTDADTASRVNDPSQRVYFVVHGIRANNDDWVKALSTMIESQLPNARAIPPFYGRFSAFQFAVPLLRRKRVRFFQNLYSMEFSKNPQASFNFVGHSYGTYLLGHSLRNLSGMQFDRVSLNGSVLPAQWLWDIYRHQVKELRNARARTDMPVGILCRALRGLRMRDVGTAGYTGFQIPFDLRSELRYYQGGHSASVSGDARQHILNFLLHGNSFEPQPTLLGEDKAFSTISAASWALPYLLLILCGLVSWAWIRFEAPLPHGLLQIIDVTMIVLILFFSVAALITLFI
jgi:pimeloyl-ACP methyl ester carboxylesterase